MPRPRVASGLATRGPRRSAGSGPVDVEVVEGGGRRWDGLGCRTARALGDQAELERGPRGQRPAAAPGPGVAVATRERGQDVLTGARVDPVDDPEPDGRR